MIGGNASLPVGRPGQRYLRGQTGDEVGHFNRIPHGVDVGIAGLQVRVDLNATAGTDI